VVPAAAVLPSGFERTRIVGPPFTGDPVGFAPLPDGRFLIIERSSGSVRIASTGGTTAVAVTIPNVVATGAEQGLLGVAVDPDWPTRPYAYFYYDHTSLHCYLTMYTATGDLTNPSSTNLTLVSPFHIFTDLPDANNFHQSGTLRFAPDGKLLVTLGDDGFPCGTQNLDLFHGKLLRLDISLMPQEGSGPPPKEDLIPPDNPFPGPGVIRQLVYAWGLRNPFRFTIDSLTGDVVIGDVGFSAQEEIDFLSAAAPGDNYGWPQREGFAEQTCCGTCGQGNLFTDPIYAYVHDALPKAVICGPLYRHDKSAAHAFPVGYDGSIFVHEFYDGWIRRLVNPGTGWQIAPMVPGQPDSLNWATELAFHSDFQQGTDGALYMMKMIGVDRGLYRIVPVVTVDAPAVQVAQPSKLIIQPSPIRLGQPAHIRWNGEKAMPLSLIVQDVSGRVVRTLVDREVRVSIDLHWDGLAANGRAPASGTYFLRLESDGAVLSTAKVVLLR
jgi:glucose/arabinose dehydrogenase